MKIRLKQILPLILPFATLSGCSYRGPVNAFIDGELFMSGEYHQRLHSFDTIDKHTQLGDSFCIFFTSNGCYQCEKFESNFQKVNKENCLLTYHLGVGYSVEANNELSKFYQKYPSTFVKEIPYFIVVDKGEFTIMPFEKINSQARFKNNLKRNISISNRYVFKETFNPVNVLDKAGLTSATVLLFNSERESDITKYQTALNEIDGPIFIHDSPQITEFTLNEVTK